MNENQHLSGNELEIFISHPESHAAIADVVREAIEEWTSRNITVHQTSNARATPILVGDTLRPALETAIRKSHVLLLIYVRAELSEYCMFEAGAAGATNSRVVVFQCEEEIPKVFADDLIVNMTEKSISQFTYQFHKDKNFFPGLEQELMPRADDKLIENRSQNLYKSFQDALGRSGTKRPEPDKTFDRWICFTVSLDEPYALEIFQLTTEVDSKKEA